VNPFYLYWLYHTDAAFEFRTAGMMRRIIGRLFLRESHPFRAVAGGAFWEFRCGICVWHGGGEDHWQGNGDIEMVDQKVLLAGLRGRHEHDRPIALLRSSHAHGGCGLVGEERFCHGGPQSGQQNFLVHHLDVHHSLPWSSATAVPTQMPQRIPKRAHATRREKV